MGGWVWGETSGCQFSMPPPPVAVIWIRVVCRREFVFVHWAYVRKIQCHLNTLLCSPICEWLSLNLIQTSHMFMVFIGLLSCCQGRIKWFTQRLTKLFLMNIQFSLFFRFLPRLVFLNMTFRMMTASILGLSFYSPSFHGLIIRVLTKYSEFPDKFPAQPVIIFILK